MSLVPSLVLTVLSTLTPSAHAADCDAKQLERELKDAAPVRVAEGLIALAACDEARARKAAPSTVPRILAGDKAADALVLASKLGAGDAVRAWIGGAEPDVRSRTLEKMGEACAEYPEAVTAFFTTAADKEGAAFWEARWYKGLASCRTEPVQAMLTAALDHPTVGRDAMPRTPFYSLLETWSRNLGVAAVPKLAELLAASRDDREAVSLVNAFADAAGVGATGGADAEATAAVTEALLAAAPSLPREALERARGVFNALGDEANASAIARHAWPDAWSDAYTYGVALTNTVTCKNGKVYATLYLGAARDEAGRWPDVFLPTLDPELIDSLDLDDGSSCKGSAEHTLVTSDVPATEEALAAFADAQRAAFEQALPDAKKKRIEDDWNFVSGVSVP